MPSVPGYDRLSAFSSLPLIRYDFNAWEMRANISSMAGDNMPSVNAFSE
jgi:hypothetical protein